MKVHEKDYIKLESALKKAYQGRKPPTVSEQWEMDLMRHIRSLGFPAFKTSPFDLLGQFGWRLAPVVCVLMVVLAFWMVNVDFVPEEEMAKLSLEQPIEASYVEINGV